MRRLSNAEIANVLLGLAQLLSVQKENPFKVKAYRRAAKAIANRAESIDELVRTAGDLTAIPGIGKSISEAIREIVERGGTLQQLDDLRDRVDQKTASLTDYPRLDPKRVERVYRKLGISTVAELRERLERGDIGAQLGARMEEHIRQGLAPATGVLLYEADELVPRVEEFLLGAGAERVEAAGEYRRRVEIVRELSFLVQAGDFPGLMERFRRYGGRTTLVAADHQTAVFELPTGMPVRVSNTAARLWGLSLLVATGSEKHLMKLFEAGHDLAALARSGKSADTEHGVYRALGLALIPPELREGRDEVALAAAGRLPTLITLADLRGDLHAHTTSSDGAHTIEQMAAAARERGYQYLGITDHSQGLRIARGVSEADLRAQLRAIDALNRQHPGVRVLKSAEVDILADGSLDYPDELLAELDYTVCSIHSRFNLDKVDQTERILRAMDNRYFNILGHGTGRRLLSRRGYELDFERVVEHARQNGCFLEINSSPERLDISAEQARAAAGAGVKIGISTDAHSTRELDFIRGGVGQARRAGLEPESVLNCLPWSRLEQLFRR